LPLTEYLAQELRTNMKTDPSSKPMTQTLLPVLTMAIGVLLMVFKIVADSEPGAIPLLLIVVGAAWYFIKRFRLRAQAERNKIYPNKK